MSERLDAGRVRQHSDTRYLQTHESSTPVAQETVCTE